MRKVKAEKAEALCVLTIASTAHNSVEHYSRLEDMRFRLERIKSEASKQGYRFVKTEWATSIIESELDKLEKEFGL